MTTDYWYFASIVLRRTWDRLREQPDLQVVHDRPAGRQFLSTLMVDITHMALEVSQS